MTDAPAQRRQPTPDDPVGAPPPLPDRLLAPLEAVVDEVLWPGAQDVDRAESLPRGNFDALADLGLFGQAVPVDQGGLGLAPPMARRVLRLVGSGCGATGFAFAQHHGVAAAIARTDNETLGRHWLPALCADTLAGIAFAHVRRPGPATVAATRVTGGWRIDGEAPWATSWGLAQVFLIAATTDDDRLLWFLAPGRPVPGIVPSPPLGLLVFGATVTVRLRFEAFVVSDDEVVGLDARPAWILGDRRGAVRPNPLCLGIGDRALWLLGEVAPPVAARMAGQWDDLAERAEAAARSMDQPTVDGPRTDAIAAVAAVRAETVLAVQRLTTALLAAVGGRGAETSHPAQRLAREALFYVVQAQNDDGRRATLGALT